jgi:hypothetical protein
MVVVVIFALSFWGCASYTATTPVNPSSAQNASSVENGGIKITILPIQTKEDAKRFFDYEKLSEEGFMPIHLTISNMSQGNYQIASTILKSPDGKALEVLPEEEAYKHVKKSWVGRSLGWGLLTIVAIPISAAHTSSVNDKIMADLKEKQFVAKEVKAGETQSGFLYFKIDEKAMTLDGYSVVVSFHGSEKKEIALPLKGKIYSKGGDEQKKEESSEK